MREQNIELELVSIESITPRPIDYGEDAVLTMRCTLTKECISRLERVILDGLQLRRLTEGGIGNLADYIRYIGRRSFNKQLAEMGYETILTAVKRAELFSEVDRRKE